MRSLSTILALLIVSSTLILSACSSSEKALPDVSSVDLPAWFVNPPEDPNYVFVPRTATSRNLQTAINQATTDARGEIQRVIEVRVEAMQKNFTEEVGVDEDATFRQMFEEVTRTVAAGAQSGSTVREQKIEQDGNLYRAYVLMEYPVGAANRQLMEQMKEREEMYTRFRQSQSFQELERQVERMEN